LTVAVTQANSAARASGPTVVPGRAARKRYPIYCPLAIAFDAQRLYDELIALAPRFGTLATAWANLRDRSKWFDVGDDELNANVEHVVPDPGDPEKRRFVPGKVPGWWGISLTHVAGRPETRWGSSRYRRMFDGLWTWDEDLAIPYTRQLVESLPFDRLDVVRVMSLAPGGFGPTHIDCDDDSPWERDGLASISFVPRDGGVPTRFMATDRRLHDVRDPVFFFKDCAPHGIPQTLSRRLMLRISGAADPQRVLPLMQIVRAIW
jgi:hypothetical protein